MKTKLYIIVGALALTSCESPPPSTAARRVRPVSETRLESAPSDRLAALSAPTVTPQQYAPAPGNLPPVSADVLYHERGSDIFGSSSYTTRTQVRGPVVEEVHIGNQKVYRSP